MPHCGIHGAALANWNAALAGLKVIHSGMDTRNSTRAAPNAMWRARAPGPASTAAAASSGNHRRKCVAQAEQARELRIVSIPVSEHDEAEQDQDADGDGERVRVDLAALDPRSDEPQSAEQPRRAVDQEPVDEALVHPAPEAAGGGDDRPDHGRIVDLVDVPL